MVKIWWFSLRHILMKWLTEERDVEKIYNAVYLIILALFLGIVNNNKGHLMPTKKNKVYYVPFNFF